MLLIKVSKITYLLISSIVFVFFGALSLAGGHGQIINPLFIKSSFILFSGIYVMARYDKEKQLNTLLTIIVFLISFYCFITVILDFIKSGNPRNFLEMKFLKYTLYLGLVFLLVLFVNKIAHFTNHSKTI